MSWLKDIGSGLVSGAASLIGGGISAITGKQARDREYERQKEFAQSGIRWRVEDAKAAGIHPIYAIGANTPTYSPQAAVGTDFGLSDAGQNISRAIEAGQTRAERQEMAQIQRRYYEAQIDNVEAQTRQHEAQTDAINQGIINDALYNNVDFIRQSYLASSDKVRSLGNVPSKPSTTNDVLTYNAPKPGIDPYIIGNTYFEAPPENIADMVENPKLFAGWKGVVEAAYVLDGKVKEDFKKILMPHHRKLIDAGTHEIIRVPGVGCAVKRKGDPLKPSDFGLNSRKHHSGGPYNIY